MSDLPRNLEQFKAEQELREYYDKRRGEGFYQDVVYVRRGSTRKKPDIYFQRETFSFLQYLRVVMHWAKRNSDLTRPQIELLLYLHPIGIFKKQDFTFFCRVVQMNHNGLFAMLVEEGWIEQWRPAKYSKKQAALYTLTQKAIKLCNRIHKMCLGEEKVPEGTANKMTSSERPIDKYYMNVIKKMNEKNSK